MLALGTCLTAALLLLLVKERAAHRRTAQQLAEARDSVAAELELLRSMALHDDLTGLPNRVLLHDRLQHAVTAQRRRSGHVGVLFLDLDGFKAVNDVYGHAVGDLVLSTVASRLGAAVRGGDTAARLAGDEFVVVCQGVDDAAALRRAASRLEAAVAAPMRIGERTIRLGVSIGAVLHQPLPGETPSQAADRLIDAADTRMYDLKRVRQMELERMGVLNQIAARSVPAA